MQGTWGPSVGLYSAYIKKSDTICLKKIILLSVL